MIRKLRKLIAAGFMRLIEDPWVRTPAALPPGAFGGNERDASSALAAPSTVSVDSLDDIVGWLLGCERIRPSTPTKWTPAQRISELERTRQGNSLTLATWTFAKLHDIGYSPELVLGYRRSEDQPDAYHAWVVVEAPTPMLIEPTGRDADHIVRGLTAARSDYTPLYSASADGRTYFYRAYLLGRLNSGQP